MKYIKITKLFLTFIIFNLSIRLFGQTEIPKGINDLLLLYTCYTCHKADVKFIGPSWVDISSKGMKKAEMVAAIYTPDASRWPGYPPMMAMPQVPKKDAEKIADWIVKLKGKSTK
jgi:cytochrome c